MELEEEPPNIYSVWDTMDSFDGIFLEEDLDKMKNESTPSEIKSELDFSVENVSSIHQSSEESVRCQKKSDGILGPHPLYFSEIGKIRDRIYDANLMGSHKDDKVNSDNVKYIIPMNRYAKPFKEKPSSEFFRLAPMQNHQNFFKEDCPKWPKVRSRDSQVYNKKHDKMYQSFSNSSQPVGRHKVRHASERTPP
jgi:hypothetical protein